jgi:HD-GYP domain-containing protein (c-di-GMP phosphodiesterase class II)
MKNYLTGLLDRDTTREKVVLKVGRILGSDLATETVLNSVVALIVKITDSRFFSIMLMSESGKDLVVKACKGADRNITQGSKVKVGEGISGWVARTGKPLRNNTVIKKNPPGREAPDLVWAKDKFLSVPLMARGEIIGVLNIGGKAKNYTNQELEFILCLASQIALLVENSHLSEENKRGNYDIIRVLTEAIDAKDPYTRGHSTMVTQYAMDIARELNLSEPQIHSIKLASILHDVGKIGVDENILRKQDKLTDEEFKIIKQHPVIGEAIIKPLPFLKKECCIIRHHHERMDGKGYPDGLTGEDLSLSERILAVSDAYQAMISDRSYRKHLRKKDVISQLESNSGTQFDPQVVKALLRLISDRRN